MLTIANTSWVVVSNIFYFHPYLGKIPILTDIFQRGWNHQSVRIPIWAQCWVQVHRRSSTCFFVLPVLSSQLRLARAAVLVDNQAQWWHFFFWVGRVGGVETSTLGEVVSMIFLTPESTWGNDPFWRAYFFNRVRIKFGENSDEMDTNLERLDASVWYFQSPYWFCGGVLGCPRKLTNG